MARRVKDQAIELSDRHTLTAGLIAGLTCPPEKMQAFLRDTESPGLQVRVTAAGAKSYVFEGKLNRRTIRRTIGDIRSWSIDRARSEARNMRVQLDGGTDPREVERSRAIQADKEKESAKRHATTVGEAWAAYVAERKLRWGTLHYRDHLRKVSPGGQEAARGTRGSGVTRAGPLFPLMGLPLRALDAATIEAWAAHEGNTRATSARLAWRLLKVFLRWCSENPTYKHLVPEKNPAKTHKARESLGRPTTKSDVLQREQLATWFAHVQQIENRVIATSLQVMLLTGARPGEVLAMRWEDISTTWKGLTIRDKVDGLRVIPATPYVLELLASLPRRNEWVFSSPTSETGRLSMPSNPHTTACLAAGLSGLTLNGLRRSFSSLTEWLEVPTGVVAQIQGHKPSATAEKHYKVRPLELLRLHHERIENWILEQADVRVPSDFPQVLRAVT